MIALFGVAVASAASAAPSSKQVVQNPCESLGLKKEWCVDGHLLPELMAHLEDYSGDSHSRGTKRDDFMEAHDHAEFTKRRFQNKYL